MGDSCLHETHTCFHGPPPPPIDLSPPQHPACNHSRAPSSLRTPQTLGRESRHALTHRGARYRRRIYELRYVETQRKRNTRFMFRKKCVPALSRSLWRRCVCVRAGHVFFWRDTGVLSFLHILPLRSSLRRFRVAAACAGSQVAERLRVAVRYGGPREALARGRRGGRAERTRMGNAYGYADGFYGGDTLRPYGLGRSS